MMNILLTESQLKKIVKGVNNNWKNIDGKLIRVYHFPTYKDTVSFVNKVFDIAQEQNHHPEMVVGYDSVKVIMFDHEKGGISDKCHKFTDAVDGMVDKEESLDERSRSFAFTRKKRLFPKSAMMSNPDRFKKYDKEVKGLVSEEKSYETKPIVFIGTAGAGKSTTAKKVAESLGIEYIDVDERQGSEEYQNLCKGEPGVEVSIIRTANGHQEGKSNDAYKRCVLNKLLQKYGNSKVVLDIGAGTEEGSDLLTNIPNLFVLGVPTNSDDDKPYLDFLKKSRINRAIKMGNQDLIDKETNMDTSHIQQSISNIRDYYRGKQFISVLNNEGKQKTTEELTQEIIFKLT